eukprot:TRINITY_DN7936_c0_g1_i1.p1 TRINITY_DN7936_c0_g1~~TRINITY_DN7936_c0_g1_i1.p1  ORF type:complete len:487 (+),score=128.78 TRINITY_DN7936_c0_g1_i1:79-1539(+)
MGSVPGEKSPDLSDPQKLGYVTWLVISTCVCIVLCYLFLMKRHSFPIKGRFVELVVITAVHFQVFTIIFTFAHGIFPRDTPAVVEVISEFQIASMGSLLYVIRLWKFYFESETATARNLMLENSWYLKNQQWGDPKFLKYFVVVGYAFFFATAIALSAGTRAFELHSVAFPGRLPSLTTVLVTSAIFIVGIIIMAYLLRHRKDGYFIVVEFQTLVLIISFGTCMWYIFDIVADSRIPSCIFLNITVFCVMMVSLAFPLYRSYQFESEFKFMTQARVRGFGVGSQSEVYSPTASGQTEGGIFKRLSVRVSGNLPSAQGTGELVETKQVVIDRTAVALNIELADALKSPVFIEKFREFLVSELSVENLLWLLEMEGFFEQMRSSDQNTLAQTSLIVYKKYMADLAPFKLNLSAPTVKQLHKIFREPRADGWEEKVNMDTFATAQEEIYKLVSSDSFLRFRKGALFASMIDNIVENTPKKPSMDLIHEI